MSKKTVLYDEHKILKAEFAPFAGWEMPIEYEGVLKEHETVRTKVGLFDVSHMGEIEVKGRGALDFCQKISTNDVSALKAGKVQYSAILNERGGIIDDCTVYALSNDHYLFVVNASRKDEVLKWFESHAQPDVLIQDQSDAYGLLALQGPQSEKLLADLAKRNLDTVRYYEFIWAEILGAAVLISRTGYTGEDGFEIYVPVKKAADLWRLLLEKGGAYGIKPIGLAARDTLRLEMGYLLYGSDMDESITPLECGLSWIVKMDKGAFIGREALLSLKNKGIEKKLHAFEMIEKGVPRPHYHVKVGQNTVGEVTSGTFSPSKKIGIGLAYLQGKWKTGDRVSIQVRQKELRALITKTPFVQGTVKK